MTAPRAEAMPFATGGPGAMLRAAREAARIDLAELARRTRLEVRVLEALEGDEYLSLPATAFVKGYIRSVSRALDIDPAPVLARHAELDQSEDPDLADFATRSPAEITSSSLIIKVTSGVLLLAVAVLMLLWWRHHYQATDQSPEALAALSEEMATPPPDPGIPLPYTWTIVEHSHAPLEPVRNWRHQTDGSAPPAEESALPVAEEAPAQADEAAPPPVPATPVVTPPPAPAASEARPEPAASAAPRASREPPASPPPRVSETLRPPVDPAVPRAAPRPRVTPPPAPRGQELVVTGRGESWLEITDSAGKRLFMGTIKPGQRLAMKGRPPYDLVVGFPPAISATFGGQPVDLRARPRDGSVPRFRLSTP